MKSWKTKFGRVILNDHTKRNASFIFLVNGASLKEVHFNVENNFRPNEPKPLARNKKATRTLCRAVMNNTPDKLRFSTLLVSGRGSDLRESK